MTLECGCPESFPDWHEQDIDLGGTAAHILGIPTFLHMPLSYGIYAARQHQAVEQLELKERYPGLMLTKTGVLRGKIISLLEQGNSPSRFVQSLPLDFKLRGYLHPGGIGTIREAHRALQSTLFDLGRMPKEMYLCYLTCPRCADDRGGDKILVLRRWQASTILQRRLNKQG